MPWQAPARAQMPPPLTPPHKPVPLAWKPSRLMKVAVTLASPASGRSSLRQRRHQRAAGSGARARLEAGRMRVLACAKSRQKVHGSSSVAASRPSSRGST